MPTRKEDLLGKTFGRLTVDVFSHKDSKSNNYYQCDCSCGNTKTVAQNHLLSGKIKSCGCLKRKSRPMEESNEDSILQEMNRLFTLLANRYGIYAFYQTVRILNCFLQSKNELKVFKVVLN